MTYDDSDVDEDDEDWHDDENDSDEPETGHCPECGGPVYEFSDKCPACGYWLSAADRRDLWSGETKPAWVKIAAVVVLVVLALSLLRLVPIGF
jgi:hypothetical protein